MLFYSLQFPLPFSVAKFSHPQKQIQSTKPISTNSNSLQHLSDSPFLDSTASVHILNSYAASRDSQSTACIHAAILKSGIKANVFVANSLLGAYSKCGHLEDAARVFEQMPARNVVSWTCLITGYCHNGYPEEAIFIFRKMLEDEVQPNEFTLSVLIQACRLKKEVHLGDVIHAYLIRHGLVGNLFIKNSLIDMYSKCGSLTTAEKLVDALSCNDVVSWTSLIVGCVLEGLAEKALVLFFRMHEAGVMSNAVTILSIIRACSLINEPLILKWVHGWVIKSGFCADPLVMNVIVEMYCGNGFSNASLRIFSQFCFTGECQYLNPETMASLVKGCAHLGLLKLGKGIHGYLIKHGILSYTVVENALMDMYAKNKQVSSAYRIFSKMNERDVISWNTMILCYAKNEHAQDGLQLLTEVHSRGGGNNIVPDFVTMLNSLQACAELASLQQGEIIHGYVIRSGLGCDVFIGNSLLDMYSKAGRIDSAERIFEDMPVKDLGSWNSMIAAYGIHGHGQSAVRAFAEMKEYGGCHPNAITFVSVLSACSHSGLITEGYECFNSMSRDYGIKPCMEHFACMVDLLARSGRLGEAEDFIAEMPVRPRPDVWGALLGVCGLYGKVDFAERVAERLMVLEPEGKVWRVALANVYAGMGRWEKAVKVREEMKTEELRKAPGWSCIEIKGERHKFMVGDTRHPKSMKIYETLNGIREQIREVNYLGYQRFLFE